MLALSENDIPFDPYSTRTLDPDFGGMLFEEGAREIDSGGRDGEVCGRLKDAVFAGQSPFNDVRHVFYLTVPGYRMR